MAYPTTLDSFTTWVDNVDTIMAAHINDVQTALVAIETELGISTDRPKFLAYNSATDTDVTGDGTVATVDVDTEVFDDGADFATDTFTAPVAGRYLFAANVRFSGQTSNNTSAWLSIVTSNRTYTGDRVNPYASIFSLSCVVIADMDAGDTAYVTLTVSATDKGVDIYGHGSAVATYFCGAKLP